MQLHLVDWLVIGAYFALALGIGLWFKNRANSSFVEYFASGRSLPWWIAGTSMVATTFAADTPLAVTGLVAKHGVAGNWVWWAWAMGGMLTVFVFAKLWRRAQVLTDVEFIELRYTGRAASLLRGFRAFYIAVVMNSIVIGWVTKAMADVLRGTVLHDLPNDTQTDLLLIAGMLAITGLYSTLSGMWGVAITDVVQFVLAMLGSIALAVVAVAHFGGIDGLREQAQAAYGGADPFAFVPTFTGKDAVMPLGVFAVLVLSQWWATWYPGAEPGGGGYIVQRMAACKDERHAVKATLLFQLAHYCVRPWPWILVALAAVAMHPELRTAENPGAGYPMVIRELAPIGLRGLMLVTFAAAFMSTISTQMNWGASYLVNDLYRRFVAPQADDRQLLAASRWASGFVLLLGGGVAFLMLYYQVSVDDAWQFLAALGAGVGAVFMLRWFWWRINVYSEWAAMLGSLVLFVAVTQWQSNLAPDATPLPDEYKALLVASLTLVLWLAVTLATPAEPRAHLLAFYRQIRPEGPGWRPIAALAPEVRSDGQLGKNLLCALLGTAAIWTTLPGIGAWLLGDTSKAVSLLLAAGLCLAGVLLLARRA